MRREWGTALAVVALAGGLTLAVTGPAGASVAATSVSSGEAGYVATGASGAFTSVASDWTQPTARCASGDQYASFWVGLDGYSSSTVEQTGTEADCIGKSAEYVGWYELYPAAPVFFSNPIAPGDAISASVTYLGSNKFSIKLADATQGWSHAVTQTLAGTARSSAEILVSASSTSPVTNFGRVSYTGAMVNKAGLCKSDAMAVSSPGFLVSPISGCTNFTVTQVSTSRS